MVRTYRNADGHAYLEGAVFLFDLLENCLADFLSDFEDFFVFMIL
jgi:hypothetical protein